MSTYLLIESRDPFEIQDVRRTQELASSLARDKHDVTLLFIENGVFAARESALSPQLAALARDGVRLLAEEFSLRERGITPAETIPAVGRTGLDTVIDHLEQGHRLLWH